MALLRPKEREIVALLRSGTTSLTDIAEQLGYADQSAVSKWLAGIRARAEAFFDALAGSGCALQG
jgi:DNA-binding CsgD family transcriptional regulator